MSGEGTVEIEISVGDQVLESEVRARAVSEWRRAVHAQGKVPDGEPALEVRGRDEPWTLHVVGRVVDAD
ncbi:hypothetical protein H9623_02790 [Oerskovia sp. Sa1BUA8]|uniref:Uncharacterized protein n=1 Tax=Oerskovia douganii TaxID=2762210 RepID=A0A9D5YX50_9CELL|nr:hypothetical protein [Oerskovia douganii]MBE7699233.1 hypothetical protein [Oerskovia douganii]